MKTRRRRRRRRRRRKIVRIGEDEKEKREGGIKGEEKKKKKKKEEKKGEDPFFPLPSYFSPTTFLQLLMCFRLKATVLSRGSRGTLKIEGRFECLSQGRPECIRGATKPTWRRLEPY